jgi:hypothetical protein
MNSVKIQKFGTLGRYVNINGNVDASIQLNTLDFSTGTTSLMSATLDFTMPKDPVSRYELAMVNNSTVSDVTCKVYNNITGLSTNSTGCLSLVNSYSFGKEQTQSKFIDGIFNGCNVCMVFSNDSTTLNTQGFTNYCVLKEVY